MCKAHRCNFKRNKSAYALIGTHIHISQHGQNGNFSNTMTLVQIGHQYCLAWMYKDYLPVCMRIANRKDEKKRGKIAVYASWTSLHKSQTIPLIFFALADATDIQPSTQLHTRSYVTLLTIAIFYCACRNYAYIFAVVCHYSFSLQWVADFDFYYPFFNGFSLFFNGSLSFAIVSFALQSALYVYTYEMFNSLNAKILSFFLLFHFGNFFPLFTLILSISRIPTHKDESAQLVDGVRSVVLCVCFRIPKIMDKYSKAFFIRVAISHIPLLFLLPVFSLSLSRSVENIERQSMMVWRANIFHSKLVDDSRTLKQPKNK